MKQFLRIFVMALTIICMSIQPAEAQRHQGAGNNREHSQRQGSGNRPGAGSRPSAGKNHNRPGNNNGGNHGNRPGNGGRPGTGNRPGNNSGNRPGNGNNGGNHGNRPGNGGRPGTGNRPGSENNNSGNHGNRPGNRPGNNGNHGNRPGNRPGHGGNHGDRPGHRPPMSNHRPGPRPPMVRPPHRPHRPPMIRPHYRPVPPPSWRARHHGPYLRGILGLTFGTTFSLSLDYLFNNGYTVDGYGNNIVYLRNAPALNLIWTDAALYYGNNGLDLSSFYYSTPVYDLARYNSCYNAITGTYGTPYEVTNNGGVLMSTWFTGGNTYITLSFGANNGRYLTTLSLGM